MILVLVSLNIAVAVAEGIVTVKSVAFRLPSRFKLTWLGVPLVPPFVFVVVVVVVVPVVVLLMLFCNATVALVGGFNPRFRMRSLLTCITAISTSHSGLAFSQSPPRLS